MTYNKIDINHSRGVKRMHFRIAGPKDYDETLSIWEESVIHTHDFLKKQDIEEMKKEIPGYFPMVTIQLWYDDDEIIGFSGTNEQNLEMLFLKPNKIGRGYGQQVMNELIQQFNVRTVDVNEENKKAARFYKRNGFHVVKRSALDSSGRPYPILHLELK